MKELLITKVLAAGGDTPIRNDLTLSDIIRNGMNVVLMVGGIAIFAMFLYAAWLFITSEGNAEKVTTARHTLLYAIIGIIIIALSYSIVLYLIKEFNS